MPPQNQMPETPFPVENPPAQHSSHLGATIGIILVVLLLAVGGAYFFYTQSQEQQKQDAEMKAQEEAEMTNAAEQQAAANASNEDTIKYDLDATAAGDSNADLDSLNNSL